MATPFSLVHRTGPHGLNFTDALFLIMPAMAPATEAGDDLKIL